MCLGYTVWRIVCPGEGLPPELVQDMFHSSRWVSQEGLGLSMCRKILKLMKGEVQYIMESERCYFLIVLDLPLQNRSLLYAGWHNINLTTQCFSKTADNGWRSPDQRAPSFTPTTRTRAMHKSYIRISASTFRGRSRRRPSGKRS